ncbi:hypothetical protein HPB48_008486 [Haemaphysalis longicornis]|uniref:Uncharacterized protein n=1 Tax=Haemaphysalis longicornis TaxID=44386 RepID=A0A9J6FQC3_HAELO|nr:hypothetical protein HPB48_008486 [Haemaphysalis longicornis]
MTANGDSLPTLRTNARIHAHRLRRILGPPALCLRVCDIVTPEPRQLGCGHVLCDVCYEEVSRNNSPCPFRDGGFCDSKTDTRTTGMLKKLILGLDAHCPNVVRGCPLKGTMDRVRIHFLEDCGFGEVVCRRCGMPLVHNEVVDHWFRHCDGYRRASLRKKVQSCGEDIEDTGDTSEGDELERSLRKFLLSNMRDHDMLIRSQDRITALAEDLMNSTSVSGSGLRSSASTLSSSGDVNVQHMFLVVCLPGEFPLGDGNVVVRWNPDGAVQYFTASGRSFQLRYFSVEDEEEKELLFEIRMLVGDVEPRERRFGGKLTLFLGGAGGIGLEELPTLRCSAPAGTNRRSGKPAAPLDRDVWQTVAVTEPVDVERLHKSGLFGLACFAVEVA